MDKQATSIRTVGATLGEGPVWVAREEALYFVDIKAPCVYRFRPEDGGLDRWDAPAQVGWILPATGGAFLAGLQTGLHRFDPATGAFNFLVKVEDRAGNRLNDAAADATGRVWFGSMDNEERDPTGRLYCWDAGKITDTGAEQIVITNGPAIAPDQRTLYAVDTVGRRVNAHEMRDDGTLGAGRVFVDLADVEGNPDGAIADAEGGVWVCFFGGWAARRYAPDGTCTDTVRFPAANITKMALGGPDGRTAYATSARKGLREAQLAEQGDAGDLFTFRVDVPGVPVKDITL
ncbi:SMP-30/gluconolactonase/LRE family protein [Stakelama saccharophila]|uniref:SMP-30/gluconolactonase/LRE family protein n=1 Tax=Stakelama saccharophila TaxID=3075605 RepID=A0ABZ0B4W2_9SPHN|nr:SMP-30/gluconolactonase/LRE family protein [Stakelama sp. W311]WNO52365.1 SMP-30/gluconolactonase/LRE family protein [Stakelama sp. W311]